MPSKRIIILDQPETNPPIYRVALWADVPAARQAFYADPAKVSAWKDASAAENLALQTGAVVETVETINVPSDSTLAQARQVLQDRWVAYQAGVTAANPWIRYGSFWAGDGSVWTAAGVS